VVPPCELGLDWLGRMDKAEVCNDVTVQWNQCL
jgi:hypothetical protein